MMLIRPPRFLSSSPTPGPREPRLRRPLDASRIFSSPRPPGRRSRPRPRLASPSTDLRRLTARIVDLTRRRQLAQIIEEVEATRRRVRGGGLLNTIVMNAVLEACVRCGDVDRALRLFEEMRGPTGCGVDGVSYGILLKGLGIARRIDEAFGILESIEKDSSIGSPRLSPHLICGFLNALIEAGELRIIILRRKRSQSDSCKPNRVGFTCKNSPRNTKRWPTNCLHAQVMAKCTEAFGPCHTSYFCLICPALKHWD